jgi:hypothetical protein
MPRSGSFIDPNKKKDFVISQFLGNLLAMSNEIPRPGSRSVLRSRQLRLTSVTTITALFAFGGFAATSGLTAQAASAPAKYKSTVKFTGTKQGKPTLKVMVSDKVKGGRKITRVAITLPSGFSFDKKKAVGHIKVADKRFEAGVKGKTKGQTLTIDPKNASETLTIDVNHVAIIESKKARAAKAGKVKLKINEVSASSSSGGGGGGGGGGTTGKSVCGTSSTTPAGDLENTITGLVTDLQGLAKSSPSLGGLLGDTVSNLGNTVCSVGTSISGVGTGSAGSAAETDLTTAASDLQAALTDLGSQNTSGAETQLQAAATQFENALEAGGSELSTAGTSALTELEGTFATITNALEGAAGGSSGSNPAASLESALSSLETELGGSNPLSGLLGGLVGDLSNTLSQLTSGLTGVTGSSPAGADLSAAAASLQTAITDLGSQNTSGAATAFQTAGQDLVGAVEALGSGSSASGLLTQLESELGSLESDAGQG